MRRRKKHVSRNLRTVRFIEFMAFELKIKFLDQDLSDRAIVKARVSSWLEAIGRSDYVEGIIDGIEDALTEDEKSSGIVSEGRFDDAPIVLFDSHSAVCDQIRKSLLDQFGPKVFASISEITDQAWASCWRDTFEPLETKKFLIVPLSSGAEQPPGKFRIELVERDGVFGNGQHATTRAVIHVLEDNLLSWHSTSLLDVGTGTGIYLILAGLLGVQELVGTEISEDLAEVARENCEISGVKASVLVMDRPILEKKFDLIIANILPPVLHDLMPDLASQASKGCRLILAGFIAKDEPQIIRRAQDCGFKLSHSTSELGWKCVVFEFS